MTQIPKQGSLDPFVSPDLCPRPSFPGRGLQVMDDKHLMGLNIQALRHRPLIPSRAVPTALVDYCGWEGRLYIAQGPKTFPQNLAQMSTSAMAHSSFLTP